MADVLLNRLINGEISSKLLSKWLLHAEPEGHEDFKDIVDTNVSQLSFVTFFLNFVHDQAPSDSTLSATPQKLRNPKIVEKTDADSPKVFKSALFPTTPIQKQNPNSSYSLDIHNGNQTSTPKNSNMKNSHFSSISPLYNISRQNNTTDSEKTPHSYKKDSASDRYRFSLEDFIVNSSRNSSKKKRKHEVSSNSKIEASRRIKPTNICLKENNKHAFQESENSFNFQNHSEELSVETAREQRTLLVKEKANILLNQESIEGSCRPALFKRHCSPSKLDSPILKLVTFKQNIDYVIDIYKIILDHQLTLNITSEIYFLISLFLIKQKDQTKFSYGNNLRNTTSKEDIHELDLDSNLGVDILNISEISITGLKGPKRRTEQRPSRICNSDIFHSIHNLVYFAIRAMETQARIIQLYDKATIRLLADNDRIKDFAPDLSKTLLTNAEENNERPCVESISLDSQTNVCFNIDTDNQETFPDNLSFHAFRKQRDLFYEILRIWENNHLVADWNLSNGLSGKIRTLFSLNSGSANLMHLARLFKNQLLSSCAKGSKEKGLSEANLGFISSLRIDADKLNRLTNRLVTKEVTNGINSLPTFTGYQEFFKEFINVSMDYKFSMHLSDCLIFEIVELNNTKFSVVGLDEEGNEVDLNARKLYANCIRNLRILAKFLGYLESLPYKTQASKLPSSLVEAQIEIREQIRPALDIKSLLQSSVEHRTLVFIVPWLTKYLAMLDFVTLRLPYYRSICGQLFDLYQNYETSQTPHYNVAVVKFCLGWLFEMPHFPEIEYLKFCTERFGKRRGALDLNNDKNGQRPKAGKCLDCMGIVNRNLLYLCCPYLDEIKKLLSSNAPGSRIAVKYITPVTAVESNSEMATKKLEQQLEDAFFSGQPTSLRKTIEFVSERVASTSVKFICQDLVPSAKSKAVAELKEYLNKIDTSEMRIEIPQRKKTLQTQVAPLAEKHFSRFLQNCDDEVQKMSDLKIPKSLDGLLPVDTLIGTKQICIAISKKMCIERVKQWIVGHVNLAMFTKDFDSEILKRILNGRRNGKEKVVFLLPPGGRDCSHDENTLSGFHILNNLREACCKAMENFDITTEFVANLLKDTYSCLTQRNDMNDMIIVTITTTLFDFCVLLVAKYPEMFAEQGLLTDFIGIWALYPKSATSFRTFFAPRNVHILQSSRNTQESWSLYARLMCCLLNNHFVDLDDLESQCTGFYNKDWDAATLSSYSHFLKKLVSCSSGEEAISKNKNK